MAQYRFSAQVIGRSSGRSSVAAAAYRAGVSLADERTGLVHDFSRRHGILHTEIIAPENAPAWMSDRARLWNAVEKVETRTNSQLAREVQLSLPHELDDAQRLALVRGFVREQFVSRGMIADLALHAPGRDGDDRNHHAHIMLTMRELTGEGFHKSKATPAAREWNAKENIEQWREAWGEYQNRTFQRLGLDIAVDHRSLSAQGIDREATFHLGPSANDMERRGKPSRIVDQNRAIEGRNDERTKADRASVVISLELERLKRAEASALHDRLTALKSAQALTALDLERRQHVERLHLQVGLEATYGDQKRNLAASSAAIASRLAATGFKKVLRDLTGKTARDRSELDAITRTFAAVTFRETGAKASLQKQHGGEREAQQLAQAKQQQTTAARVAADFEAKRRAELRARRDAQIAERARQVVQQKADQHRQRFSAPPISRARPPAETARPTPAPILTPEKPAMKREFENADELKRQVAAIAETEKKFLRVPAPQPTPRGDIITPRREAVDVPKPTPAKMEPPKRETPSPLRTAAPEGFGVQRAAPSTAPQPVTSDRAAHWAKVAQDRADQSKAAPTPAREFEKSATPAQPTPAATEQKPVSRADYWNEQAKAKAADREQEQPRDRSQDRDFDRER